jgi:hypothetical protein
MKDGLVQPHWIKFRLAATKLNLAGRVVGLEATNSYGLELPTRKANLPGISCARVPSGTGVTYDVSNQRWRKPADDWFQTSVLTWCVERQFSWVAQRLPMAPCLSAVLVGLVPVLQTADLMSFRNCLACRRQHFW